MMRARLILAVLVVAFITSASAALYFGLLSGELPKKLSGLAKNISAAITIATEKKQSGGNSVTSTSTSEIKININNNGTTKTSTMTVYPSPTPPAQTAPVKSCSRATVYHLDGSTSRRCYSQSDANQINNLAGQYQSVQSNIDWQTRIYEQDKWAYETYGGDLFKTSMERHAKDLQAAQAKLGPIVLQMQEIEKRGY